MVEQYLRHGDDLCVAGTTLKLDSVLGSEPDGRDKVTRGISLPWVIAERLEMPRLGRRWLWRPEHRRAPATEHHADSQACLLDFDYAHVSNGIPAAASEIPVGEARVAPACEVPHGDACSEALNCITSVLSLAYSWRDLPRKG